jgi:hypothetical protein
MPGDGFRIEPLPKLLAYLKRRSGISDGLDSGEPRIETRLDEDRRGVVQRPGFDGGDGQAKLVVVEQEVADGVAVGGRTNTDRLHCPEKAIEEATLDELERLRFLAGSDRVAEQSAAWPVLTAAVRHRRE